MCDGIDEATAPFELVAAFPSFSPLLFVSINDGPIFPTALPIRHRMGKEQDVESIGQAPLDGVIHG